MEFNVSRRIKEEIEKALAMARERLDADNLNGAAELYETAGRLQMRLSDFERLQADERKAKKRAQAYFQLAKQLRAGKAPKLAPQPQGKRAQKAIPEAVGREKDESDEFEQQILNLLTTSRITWGDIGGLKDTKEEIKFTIGLSLARRPENVKIVPWRNILFYGPPGTGKTLLAAATSRALAWEGEGSAFFNVKVSSILSKWVGDSSKIVTGLYEKARDMSPSVIFFDEFESLSPLRDETSAGHERRLLSTILAELDGLAEKGRSDIFVLTIAATNRPWDIDKAVLSRFEKKILIPLPDRDSRIAILRILLERKGFDTGVSLEELADMTEGFSGRELERFSKDVVNAMVLEMNPRLPELTDDGIKSVSEYQIAVRPLTMDDFTASRQRVTPEVTDEDMRRHVEWKEKISS
ncbi:MAG: AAA family ATPase [Planctomycetota bacterium]|jgi:SpoVK/Ycf46/Vps4 family AAA+-type ATPase